MSIVQSPPPNDAAAGQATRTWRRRASRAGRPAAAMIARGEPTLWLTAGSLAIALFMILGLVVLVVYMGGKTFWPKRLVQVELVDGRILLGEPVESETYQLTSEAVAVLVDSERDAAERFLAGRPSARAVRTLYRIDNKPKSSESYVWIDDYLVRPGATSHPEWAVTVERTSWGRFLGSPERFEIVHPRPRSGAEEQLERLIAFLDENARLVSESDAATIASGLERLRQEEDAARRARGERFLDELRQTASPAQRIAVLESGDELPLEQATTDQPVSHVREIWAGSESAWSQFEATHSTVLKRVETIRKLDRHGLGRLSDRQEAARMDVVRKGLETGRPITPLALRLAELDAAIDDLDTVVDSRALLLAEIARRFGRNDDLFAATQRLVTAMNAETSAQRASVRKEISETEAQIPEQARPTIETYRSVARDVRRRTVEIAGDIDRLEAENARFVWHLKTADGSEQSLSTAEVVRAFPANQLQWWGRIKIYLDRWKEFLLEEPREANTEGGVLPAIWGTVAMTLIMTVVAVPFGVLAALYLREYAKAGLIVSAVRIAVNNLAGVPSIVFGVFGLGFFCYTVGAGIDQAFYPAYVSENRPVFGTGGLLWASLTLALLTLPVVIVATEEALAAVPNSLREGSYACGGSKWQTIRQIVLPRALPGIMTGMILAMARGAGEVAPLMLVGAVKIAPELPLDAEAPFLHPTRSFMHLGFHIYDLGFQSPDSQAARPMVFTTTLLLISIVAVLNILAIRLRSRLRRRFAASQF